MYSKFIGIVFKIADLSGFRDTNPKNKKESSPHSTPHLKHLKVFLIRNGIWSSWMKSTTFCTTNLFTTWFKNFFPGSWSTASECSPAKHREEEYFDLLALLEPNKYVKDDPKDLTALREEFKHLFERQQEIGSRINIAKRRLSTFKDGNEKSASKVIKQIQEILKIPVISKDSILKEKLLTIEESLPVNENFVDLVESILFHVSDYYRINRRIIRNRREKIIENKQLKEFQEE